MGNSRMAPISGSAGLHAAAFVMEQGTASNAPLLDLLTTVDNIERRARPDFFWQLPDVDESAMESVENLDWAQTWLR